MERLTIREVIEHCNRHTERVESHSSRMQLEETPIGNSDFMKQYWKHRQVSEWLEELSQYKELLPTPQMAKDLINMNRKHEKNALENAHIVDEYRSKQEQGLLIELPCKVGDKLWWLNGKFILEYEVESFNVVETGAWLMHGIHYDEETDKTYSYALEVEKIGKTVFLTRSEAEEALARMKGE